MNDLTHKISLGVAIVALTMFVLLGTGVVLYGLLTGVGMFVTLFVIALRKPSVLVWCREHPATTELGSTFGTFLLFSVFATGTVTAAIAATVVCLLCTAVLGFSKLAWIERRLGVAVEVGEKVISERFIEPRIAAKVMTPRVKPQGSLIDAAIARAVARELRK